MLEERIVSLETKILFQEAAIENLQKITQEQFLTIHHLEMTLNQLADRIKNDLLNSRDIGPASEKPPHY